MQRSVPSEVPVDVWLRAPKHPETALCVTGCYHFNLNLKKHCGTTTTEGLKGHPAAQHGEVEMFTLCKCPLMCQSVNLETINQTCFDSLMKHKHIIGFFSLMLKKNKEKGEKEKLFIYKIKSLVNNINLTSLQDFHRKDDACLHIHLEMNKFASSQHDGPITTKYKYANYMVK